MPVHVRRFVVVVVSLLAVLAGQASGQASGLASGLAHRQVSGIYPHLAMFNDENECGTGAVVPWADRLWVITYAPHAPRGSSDKLYEVTPALQQIVRAESVGGTPANRMIHRESQQLFVGPYVIGADRNVRVIPSARMYGRLTANARHLTDPADKVYFATMEEGIYEVDVDTLAVTELWADEQREVGRHADLPGYHGKGLYSGQGRLVYANNGEHGQRARVDPRTPSGVLASWDGKADGWTIVRRNQFTEVTGPGGIHGNDDPERDPIWSIGWDHRSLLLQVLDGGAWHTYRLPKGSHSYDGAHGWNTEWPRIREIGERDLLMTMHGIFWRFPATFRPGRASGIAPRSAYLKVVGDFCRWQGRVVFGCDDTAKNEFLNKRRAKGEIAAPRSQSNLWFVEPSDLDRLGPAIATGGIWTREDVAAGAVSEPMLVHGWARRGVHFAHATDEAREVVVEVDADGGGEWRRWQVVELDAGGYRWLELPAELSATWLRVRAPRALRGATVSAHFAAEDGRGVRHGARFDALASAAANFDAIGGLVRARGGKRTTLAFAAQRVSSEGVADIGCYELDGSLALRPAAEPALHAHTLQHAAIPQRVVSADAASLVYVDEAGARWRLPQQPAPRAAGGFAGGRVVREIATERDVFHAGGTFYELPAINAGGFARLRPIASHRRLVHDLCSFRGLLVMSGVDPDAPAGEHVVRSADGKAALWVGAIDDLWQLGKPRGIGGPWLDTAITAGEASDPYLVRGFDDKRIELSHDREQPVGFRLEADLSGDGHWTEVRTFAVPVGETVRHEFSRAWSAYWLRVRGDRDCRATVQLTYR